MKEGSSEDRSTAEGVSMYLPPARAARRHPGVTEHFIPVQSPDRQARGWRDPGGRAVPQYLSVARHIRELREQHPQRRGDVEGRLPEPETSPSTPSPAAPRRSITASSRKTT